MFALALKACGGADQHDPAVMPAMLGGQDQLAADVTAPASLDEISALSTNSGTQHAAARARARVLRNEAMRFGSQHGFTRRSWEIRRKLETHSTELSAIYDFSRVTIPAPQRTGYLLPPVIMRARYAFEMTPERNTVSAADEIYAILRGSTFSPTPPSWRDYLLFESENAATHHNVLRPVRTQNERKQRDVWIRQGWIAGQRLADAELELRIRRLRRDFEGMLEYRRLLSHGMISPPEIDSATFGVTGEPGTLRIGDRTTRIIERSDFLRNPLQWKIVDE